MRIKHWQGYGSVNAKKLSKGKTQDNCTKLVVEVTGNHEWGLVRNDVYDVHRWLVGRFVKDCPSYRNITNMRITEDESGDVDKAVYEITYRPE